LQCRLDQLRHLFGHDDAGLPSNLSANLAQPLVSTPLRLLDLVPGMVSNVKQIVKNEVTIEAQTNNDVCAVRRSGWDAQPISFRTDGNKKSLQRQPHLCTFPTPGAVGPEPNVNRRAELCLNRFLLLPGQAQALAQ
jgi:hypothetical protein